MACECIKETKESLKKHYTSRLDIEKVNNVSLENTAIMFNDGPSTVELYSPVKIEYDYEIEKVKLSIKRKKQI